MRNNLGWWMLAGIAGWVVGCQTGGGGSSCQAGTYFCPCLQGTCEVGLMCVDGYCLNSGDDSTTGDGDPTTGDGDGDGDCPSNGPYQGGWDTGCCQNNVVPTAWSPGNVGPNSVLPDWTFNDQFGDAVRVWDFCHEAIYFEYVAFW